MKRSLRRKLHLNPSLKRNLRKKLRLNPSLKRNLRKKLHPNLFPKRWSLLLRIGYWK